MSDRAIAFSNAEQVESRDHGCGLETSSEALAGLENQLSSAPVSAQVVNQLLRVAELHYNATRPLDAIRAAQAARVCASACGDRGLKRRASSILGAMLTDHARYQEAAEALTDALLLAREGERAEEEMPVLSNLATLLCSLGQYHGAEKAASRALELSLSRSDLGASQAVAAANLLDVALATHNPSIASEWLYGSLPPWANAPPEVCLGRTLFFANRARLFVILNDISRAKSDVDRLRERDLPVGRSVFVAGLAEGVVDCALGRVEAGLSRLEELKERTRQIGSLYQDALAACAEGAEVAGRADRALRYLRDLAQLQRSRASILGKLPAGLRGGFVADRWRESSALANAIFRLEGLADRQVSDLVSAAVDCSVTSGHDLQRCFRVAKLALLFAAKLKFTERRATELEVAGKVFDVGMMAIPGRVLSKTRGLSAGEAAIMQEHARFGYEIVRGVKLELLHVAEVAARWHHERWDGEGYPDRLSGEGIPLEARIISICDCFDAMTHSRPHRTRPLSIPAALREIEDESGTKFDPRLVRQFVEMIQKEYWLHDDFEQFLAADAYENEYVRSRQRLERLV